MRAIMQIRERLIKAVKNDSVDSYSFPNDNSFTLITENETNDTSSEIDDISNYFDGDAKKPKRKSACCNLNLIVEDLIKEGTIKK